MNENIYEVETRGSKLIGDTKDRLSAKSDWSENAKAGTKRRPGYSPVIAPKKICRSMKRNTTTRAQEMP